MLISMTPNDEVKTIHASLNDGSLRKWEFEPYTEQGKIELTDQDYATIQSIKGNTVKFNQLIQNGNFADGTNNWRATNGTISAANNECSYTITTLGNVFYLNVIAQSVVPIVNHKYLYYFEVYPTHNCRVVAYISSVGPNVYQKQVSAGTWYKYSQIDTVQYVSSNHSYCVGLDTTTGYSVGDVVKFRNIMLIDLTVIFGSGNEPTTVSDFETWLSNNIGLLPYYDYIPGTLIPFKGTGLKTTGKNLLNDTYESGDFTFYLPPGTYYYRRFLLTSVSSVNSRLQVEINGTYVTLSDNSSLDDGQLIVVGSMGWGIDARQTITLTKGYYFRLGSNIITNIIPGIAHLMLCTGSYADEYEPYTSNTLSLPISTYFPTGMKEAGSVYDEISDKAYTRTNRVVFNGSESWSALNNFTDIIQFGITLGQVKAPATNRTLANIVCSLFKTDIVDGMYANPSEAIGVDITGRIRVNILKSRLSAETVSAFQTWLSSNNVEVIYELATPTSQDISLDLTYPVYQDGTEQILPVNSSTPTTSPMVATIEYPDRTEDVDFLYKQTTFESAIPQFSLVCKNQELPMALNDGKLICECDSSITNESGFFDCKVKMQDLESVAYSQKIQLHVERGIND